VRQLLPSNRLREAARGTAVTSLVFLAVVYLPLIGFFCLPALPVLTFYYRIVLGRKTGAIIPAITGLVIIVVFNGVRPDTLVLGGLLLLGWMLAELTEQGLTIEQIVGFGCSSVFLAGFFGLIIYGNLTGRALVPMTSAYINENLALSLQAYSEMGLPAERVQAISESLDTIGHVLVRILPALCAAGTLIMGWLTILFARMVMTKKGLGFPDLGRLNRWQAPDMLVWGVIGGGLMLLLPQTAARIIGGNLMIVLGTIYLLQGLAIMSFYFEQKALPAALMVMLYGLVVFWQPLLLGIIGLGFFDMWADVRRLQRPTTDDTGPP
jgi:uncharacterized protein YybS (DUF2232 family)